MKRKYTIIHNFTATAAIEVLAETREEAFELARENDLDLCDYEFELDNAEIGKEEDVPDLEETIKKAEAIIRKAEEDEIFFDLSPWPWIRSEAWNGIDYDSKKELAEGIFWDKHFDEIAFTMTGGAEVNLSELPELQQLEICQSIINQAASNGITLD